MFCDYFEAGVSSFFCAPEGLAGSLGVEVPAVLGGAVCCCPDDEGGGAVVAGSVDFSWLVVAGGVGGGVVCCAIAAVAVRANAAARLRILSTVSSWFVKGCLVNRYPSLKFLTELGRRLIIVPYAPTSLTRVISEVSRRDLRRISGKGGDGGLTRSAPPRGQPGQEGSGSERPGQAGNDFRRCPGSKRVATDHQEGPRTQSW